MDEGGSTWSPPPLFDFFGKVLMFVHAKARSRQHAHLDMMTMVMTMGRGDKLETRTLGSERVKL